MTFPGLVAANNLSDVVDREKAWDNLGANISANVPIASPSLDLSFAANKSLVDNISGNNLITFSRASTGTFIGSNGLLQTAASGVPRFEHDGATGESLGLLVEEARTNSTRNSTNLSPSSFYTGAGGSTYTFTANQTSAPDGTTTAGSVVFTLNQCGFAIQNTGVTGTTITVSLFAKYIAGSVNTHVRIQLAAGGGADNYGLFNLTNGTFTVSGSVSSVIMTPLPNGWYRCSVTATHSTNWPQNAGDIRIWFHGATPTQTPINNTDGTYVWGAQLEAGSFPTSYIPTTGATVTRAADVMQIAGANLSSFYNAGRGTVYAEQFRQTGTGAVVSGDTANNRLLDWQLSRIYRTSWAGVNYVWTGAPAVSNTSLNRAALSYGATAQGAVNGTSYALSPIIPVASFSTASLNFQGAFSRILFWDDQLPSSAIAAITSISSVQIGALPSSYLTNATTLGKDIAALNGVRNVSTRDFVFIKGLISAVQPRLSTASQQVASGTVLRDAALLRNAPSSEGNYFVPRGVFDGSTIKINGIQAASLSSSPFSGSTALFPISIRTVELSSNFRLATTFPSGTIASPERALPVETTSLILYAKAGQN